MHPRSVKALLLRDLQSPFADVYRSRTVLHDRRHIGKMIEVRMRDEDRVHIADAFQRKRRQRRIVQLEIGIEQNPDVLALRQNRRRSKP